MGLSNVPFILLQPLGLPPSGKGWNALEVQCHGLVDDAAHHFQAAPSCPKCYIRRKAEVIEGSTVHGIKEKH